MTEKYLSIELLFFFWYQRLFVLRLKELSSYVSFAQKFEIIFRKVGATRMYLASRHINGASLLFRFFSSFWCGTCSNKIPKHHFPAWRSRIGSKKSFVFPTEAFFSFSTQERSYHTFRDCISKSCKALACSSLLRSTSSKSHGRILSSEYCCSV